MTKIDDYEAEVLSAFEEGKLKSVASKSELARLKAAARATALKDRRVNIRLSSGRPVCLGVVNASLRLDTVEEGVTIRFVRPWEIDLVLGELEG